MRRVVCVQLWDRDPAAGGERGSSHWLNATRVEAAVAEACAGREDCRVGLYWCAL